VYEIRIPIYIACSLPSGFFVSSYALASLYLLFIKNNSKDALFNDVVVGGLDG
jgi:hypothetical protein